MQKNNIIVIDIDADKLQLDFPFGNHQHSIEIFQTTEELLASINSLRYMEKYGYLISLHVPDESKQWVILYDILEFFKERHLNFSFIL